MKKFKLLVAPLLSVAFLVSCNNGGGDKPTEVKFSLSSDLPIEVLDNKTAKVYVDWTPNDIIKFESFTFDATPTKDNTVTFDSAGEPRPMPVTITFNEDITEDINGTLKFSYEVVTTKSKGESSLTFTITEQRTLHFYGTNCVLKDGEGQVISTDIIVDKGTTVTYFIDGEEGFLKPKDNQIDFTYTDDPSTPFADEHSYNPETGEVSVKLNKNVTIYAASDPEPVFDKVVMPKLGYKKDVTLNAQNGKIYIKATNATEALSSDDWLNITCELKGEYQQSDSHVFSNVDITIDGEKVTSTYGTATGPLQYWYVDIKSKKPTQDDLYIILTLNEKFVSKSGRIMKPNYTGDVSCVLWNLDASNKQEQIQIDYYSIIETAS